jgi:hypothetical protein
MGLIGKRDNPEYKCTLAFLGYGEWECCSHFPLILFRFGLSVRHQCTLCAALCLPVTLQQTKGLCTGMQTSQHCGTESKDRQVFPITQRHALPLTKPCACSSHPPPHKHPPGPGEDNSVLELTYKPPAMQWHLGHRFACTCTTQYAPRTYFCTHPHPVDLPSPPFCPPPPPTHTTGPEEDNCVLELTYNMTAM